MGERIITPSTISCYPLIPLETFVWVTPPVLDPDQMAEEKNRIKNLNRYRGWRNALRTHVACLCQFFKGESGFDTMLYPPSDRALLERLEQLQNEHVIGNGLRAEVFRAAIALAARDCQKEPVYPIDMLALEVTFSETAAPCKALVRLSPNTRTSALSLLEMKLAMLLLRCWSR